MKYRLLLAVISAAILIQFSFAQGLVMPMNKEEVLGTFDLIVVGTVSSVEKPSDKPPVYQIEIEEAIKPDSPSNDVVGASGCDPNVPHLGVPCPTYDVGDRGLFLISESDEGYELSFRSQISEADCTADQFLANYGGSDLLSTAFFWTQDGQSERLFTGKPIDIHFVVRNPDMKEHTYSIRFLTGTSGSEFSDVVNGTISECMGYEIVNTSFVPTKMGSYSFDVRADGSGSSFCCDAVVDYGSSPREQYDAEVHSQDVWCKDGLFLILKNDDTKPRSDNPPACVALETAKSLVERNWGFVPPESSAHSYFGDS